MLTSLSVPVRDLSLGSDPFNPRAGYDPLVSAKDGLIAVVCFNILRNPNWELLYLASEFASFSFFSFFTHDCQLICELMVLQVWGDCEVKLLTNTVFHSVIMNSCCAHIIRELSNTEK